MRCRQCAEGCASHCDAPSVRSAHASSRGALPAPQRSAGQRQVPGPRPPRPGRSPPARHASARHRDWMWPRSSTPHHQRPRVGVHYDRGHLVVRTQQILLRCLGGERHERRAADPHRDLRTWSDRRWSPRSAAARAPAWCRPHSGRHGRRWPRPERPRRQRPGHARPTDGTSRSASSIQYAAMVGGPNPPMGSPPAPRTWATPSMDTAARSTPSTRWMDSRIDSSNRPRWVWSSPPMMTDRSQSRSGLVRARSIGRVMFSSADRVGSRLNAWKMNPMC